MRAVQPIFLGELFAEVHDELLGLLGGLTEADWERPTAAGTWTVKDIAAHLLDSDVRRLSYQRDGLRQVPPPSPIQNYAELVGFLNQLNADWIASSRRLSPRVLRDFLGVTGPQVATLFRALDPFAPASFGVAWAGEELSRNWFDVAREYTEKWHHQQQIRDAVGAPPLTDRKWLHPVLDTFLRGLPYRFRDTAAPPDTRIVVEITGPAGGQWSLAKTGSEWRLYSGASAVRAALVRMDQDTAWRSMTKGLPPQVARQRTTFVGDAELAEPIVGMLAIMG
jgi:uncharacterized protein (TIGR03083 family)